MSDYLITITSLSSVVFLGIVSFAIFLFSFNLKGVFHRSVIRNWMIAFFFISLLKIPTIITSAGFKIDDVRLNTFNTFAFIVSTIGFLLYLRGALLLSTTDKRWLNIFPIIIFWVFVPAIIYAFSIFGVSISKVSNLIHIFDYVIILACVKILIDISKKITMNGLSIKVRSGIFTLILGLVLYIISDSLIQHSLQYNTLYLLSTKLPSITFDYFLISFAQILIFAGSLILGLNIDSPKPIYRRGLVFGILSFLIATVIAPSIILNSEDTASSLYFKTTSPSFVLVGENVVGYIYLENKQSVNAVSITLEYDKDIFSVDDISNIDSLVKIWVETPEYHNDNGVLTLSGVIPGGTTGSGNLLKVAMHPLKPGIGKISFSESEVYANDGEGTIVPTHTDSKTFYIKASEKEIPTRSKNRIVTIKDLSILISKFETNDESSKIYDLNNDGVVNLVDLSIFISMTKR